MDWSSDEPPYPSALTRPVPPVPGTGWAMVAVICWIELKDGLRDLRQWLRWRLHTSGGERRAAERYRRMLETPVSPETRQRAADRFPLSGDIHMPWVRPEEIVTGEELNERLGNPERRELPDDPLPSRPRRFWCELVTPPPEEDSFI